MTEALVLRTEILTVGLPVLTAAAAVAGILSVVLAAASYTNDPDKSLRRVAGWVVAVLGFLTTCSVLGWFVSQGLPATHGAVLVGVAVAGAGLALACVGVAIAMCTPASDLPRLRAIATAVEEYISRSDDANFDRSRYVAMSVYPRGGVWVRPVRLTRLLRWPAAQLTLLSGGSGSGKSVSLRQIVLGICHQAKQRRRPHQMVVYVDLRTLETATDKLTMDVIREHLKASVRTHDSAAAELLGQYLERSRSVRWLFIFDSMDDLDVTKWPPAPDNQDRDFQEATVAQYVRCVAQLVESRHDFRAVIAIREVAKTRTFTGPVQTMADLSSRQQRAVLRPYGITSTKHHCVFDRLDHDPTVKEIADNPLLLNMLGLHLQATEATELKRTRYEIIDGIIGTQLRAAVNPTLEVEIRLATERIAYRMFAEPVNGAAKPAQKTVDSATDTTVVAIAEDAAMRTLDAAGLGRRHRSGFQFCHRAVQVHFAAAYLLSDQLRPEAHELIISETWSDVVINALQAGSTNFRNAIVQAATDALVAEVTAFQGLVPDMQIYLQQEPLISPGSFDWPPVARHILRILREGLRFEPTLSPEPLPAAAVDAADRLILTAVLAGGLKAKEDAVDLLPVASPEVGILVAEHAFNSNNSELEGRVIYQLTVMPGVFRKLKVSVQCFAAAGALARWLGNPVLNRRSVANEDAETLSGMRHNVLRVGQVSALGLCLWLTIKLVGERDPSIIAWPGLFILLAAVFLYDSGVPTLRGLTKIGYITGAALLFLTVLVGVFYVLSVVLALLTLNIGNAVNFTLLAYLFLWPLAMVIYVVVDPTAVRTNRFLYWFLPHVRLVRMTATWLQEAKVLPTMAEVHSTIRAAATPLRVTAVAACGLLFVIASIDLPYVTGKAEENVDGPLGLVAIILALFVFSGNRTSTLRRRDWVKLKHERLPSGTVDNVELLDLLRESGGQVRRRGSDVRRRGRDNTSRLLRMLATAEPGALRTAVPALTDLDRALEFVKEMVPAETTTSIPDALWTLHPNFTLSEFSDWLIDYDKRYPGQLTWLASSRRDLLAQVIRRAEEQADKGHIIVFRTLPHGSEP